MKGINMKAARELRGGAAAPSTATDLLVCFPSRPQYLTTLMPKPISICSPEPNNNRRRRRRHHRRNPSASAGAGPWGKTKQQMGSGSGGGDIISEPTSPKVTCAGQIKVRHHSKSSGKSWQSVMEEIERIHNQRKQQQPNKRSSGTAGNWAESLGLKKEVMHFLTCLRSIRFDLRCFGSFPQPDINSDDDDEDEDDDEEEEEDEEVVESSNTAFSKWFMVMQDEGEKEREKEKGKEEEEAEEAPAVPPPPANALLLMRCRSAPAKSWMEEEEKENRGKDLKTLMEEERKKEMENKLIVMRYDTDFYKISCDVAKETWVVGGGGGGGMMMMNNTTTDPFSRSRSWKR